MNILVFVKQVPDDYVKVALGADGTPNISGIDKVVNAFDTYSVEMAVRFCESNGGKVVVATLGDEATVRPSLVQMIAVGAKQGYIATGAEGKKDESMVAAELAGLVKKCEEAEGISFDMILCGKESTDEISSQMGAMIAERLEVGFVSSVVDLEKSEDTLCAKKETGEGFNYYGVTTPCVLTIAKPEYDPRYPTLKSKMAARKAVIPCFAEPLTEEKPVVVYSKYEEPAKREAGVKIVEKDAVEAVAKMFQIIKEDQIL